ncbi:MAG: UTP--glucose-1-phosphate uridylyltransferase GalU [Acidobacteria bacterium]|nr:UTP--glucose-1-phosphate uridylyltransferase GalU [Acidobacteriota bacterium]MBA4182796.1 UTP--glucose-1-phosphate uridylyltransferase GalU [Acidobacteriota bacterium]
MKQKIRKAVFPAAGLGTRFLPATKASPKEMLPLVDKPLIQYGVEEVVASGIESILIITGRDKAAIEDHFDISFELEHVLKERGKQEAFEQVRAISEIANISYIRQKQALGLGHALYQAKDFVGDEPFAVILPDDIMEAETPALKQLIEVYEKYDAPVMATMRIEGEAISRFGVIDAIEVESNVFKIRDVVEKPKFEDAPSDMAVIGRYIFTPELFDAIEQTKPGAGGEIQVADAIRILLEKNRPYYAVKLDGVRHDAGDKLGFLIATVEFALKREDLGADFREYLKSLKL